MCRQLTRIVLPYTVFACTSQLQLCMASKLSVSLPDEVSSTDALTCSQASSSSLICAVAQLPSSQVGGLNSASSAHVLHDGHHEDVLTGDFVASRFRCSHAKRILIKVGTRVATRAQDERLALGRLGACRTNCPRCRNDHLLRGRIRKGHA